MVLQVQKVLIYVHCSLESTTYTHFSLLHVHANIHTQRSHQCTHCRTHHRFAKVHLNILISEMVGCFFIVNFPFSVHKHELPSGESLLENVRKLLLEADNTRKLDFVKLINHSLVFMIHVNNNIIRILCNNQARKMFYHQVLHYKFIDFAFETCGGTERKIISLQEQKWGQFFAISVDWFGLINKLKVLYFRTIIIIL